MPDHDDQPSPAEMDLGAIFAALADRHRRAVVLALLAEPDGTERHCSSFELPVSKATLTHHFRTLRQAGLIRQVNRGNSNMAQLRRAELEQRFPGLMELLRAEVVASDRATDPA
ncbi:ArsR/SmtB family transcription factor [Nocardia suismassiliense]|uniref:ArsR/SmtB family transcription factor n=1 Tax=Nocardia suismassiliense TaxID=2077092 RepID=UPI000D1E5EA3|nr:helix-turn-helix domain-containing protein [Nocardia suismassiliense]